MTPQQDGRGKSWTRAVRESSSYLGVGTSLAFSLLVSLWAGRWIDTRFGTEPAFFLVGAVFGLFAVFYHLYKMYKSLSKPKL